MFYYTNIENISNALTKMIGIFDIEYKFNRKLLSKENNL